MKKILSILSVLVLVASCNCTNKQPRLMTYQDAEIAFTSTLTAQDTSDVLNATNELMNLLKSGNVSSAVNNIFVVYNDVLYPLAELTIAELNSRFSSFPVLDYSLERYSFSTQAINDVAYRYSFAEASEGMPAPTVKLVFNPVKIGGKWYITLKDGNSSSKDLEKDRQLHPMAPAPDTVALCKNFNQAL